MEIWLNDEWLKLFYEILVDFYKKTEYPITVGYNNGIINVCIERPQTDIYNKVPFPHLLHKASALMETIITFHPFADGNKRAALLATYYVLHWNGYELLIPEDADKFTIEIAKGEHNLNEILQWLIWNCKRDFDTISTNLFCRTLIFLDNYLNIDEVIGLFAPFVVPFYPFVFFEYVLRRKRKRRAHQKS